MAAAAKAAGIPQEGMEGLPSSDVRNKFIEALGTTGVITDTMSKNIQKTTYNQDAGVGSSDLVNVNIEQLTKTDLITKYFSNIELDVTDLLLNAGGSDLNLIIYDKAGNQLGKIDYNNEGDSSTAQFDLNGKQKTIDAKKLSLADLFNEDIQITLQGTSWDNKQLGGKNGLYDWSVVDKVATSTLWSSIFKNIENTLKTGDTYTDAALGYAKNKITEMMECLSYVDENGKSVSNFDNAAFRNNHRGKSEKKITRWIADNTKNYVGYVSEGNSGKKYNDGYGMNLTSMSEAYLTYFAMYMEGTSNTTYNVDKLKSNCNFVDEFFDFSVLTAADTTGNNMQIAGFYDTLFNQICTKGWVENDKVDDKDYVQKMLKDGSMFLSSIQDDGYYYQDNYSTNSYVKEVTDESKIAQAEAKYNREKEKINYKENVIDMKMKNLDTEISALTTEYDTVKSVITKNIEKSFKRYDA